VGLLKGTLDVLVLKTLSWGPMHAFEITSWLEERSGGRLEVSDAALLQAIHRMEEKGFLDAEWGVTANDRRARYYSITRHGRAHLRAEAQALADHLVGLAAVLEAAKR